MPTPVPQLIQLIASSCNLSYYGDATVNNVKYQYPSATYAGDALYCFCSWSQAAGIPTISDNVNGTWPAGDVLIAGATGKLSVSFHILTGSLAPPTGTTVTVEATFSTAPALFQWDIGEHCNITGLASTTQGIGWQGAVAAGPTLATGSLTPPNNNAGGGNLILSYFANSAQTTSAVGPNPWAAGSGATLMEADNTGLYGGTNSGGFSHALQYDLQTTSAAINPGMTATTDTTYSYNCAAVALTVGAAGAGLPSTGIRIVKMLHQSIASATGGSGNTTATTAALQVPWTGNLRVCYGVTDNTPLNTLTDSDGYTWTNWAQLWPNTNAPEGYSLWGFADNTTADTNATFTIATGTGFNGFNSFCFVDIINAAVPAFDNFQGIFVAPPMGSTVTTITDCPIMSPFVNKGLTIAGMGLGNGPGLSVTSPSNAVFDYISYLGQTDGSNYDNSNLMAHLYFNSSALQNWSWTITAQAGNSTGATSAITFASNDATNRIWCVGDGAYTSGTSGSVTLPYPAGVAVGDLLLAFLDTQTGANTNGVTAPSGWTPEGSGPSCHDTTGTTYNQGFLFAQIYASGTSQTFTTSIGANDIDGVIRAYRCSTPWTSLAQAINAFASSLAKTSSSSTTTNTIPTIIENYQPGERTVYWSINDNGSFNSGGYSELLANINGGGLGIGGGANTIVIGDYNWNGVPGQIVFSYSGYANGAVGVTITPPPVAGSAGTSSGSSVVSSLRDPDVAINAWFNDIALPGTEWFDKNQPEPIGSSIVALVARLFAAITGRASNAYGSAALSAWSAAEVKSTSVLYGDASLSARLTGEVAARGAVAGSAALAGRSTAQAKASTNPLYGTAALLGTAFTKFKAFSAPVGAAPLAARTAIKVMARGALSAAGALTSIISIGAVQFKAFSALLGRAPLASVSAAAIGTPTLFAFGGSASSETTTTFTTIANIVAGNLAVIGIGGVNSGAISSVTDGTNAYTKALNRGTGFYGELWYCADAQAVSAGATITVTSGASFVTIIAAQVSSVASASPFDSSGVGALNPTSGNSNAPSVTTGSLSSTNEIIFGVTALNGNNVTYTESSGFSTLKTEQGGYFNSIILSYQIVSALSPVTYAPSLGSSVPWVALAAPFMGGGTSVIQSGAIQFKARGALSAAGALTSIISIGAIQFKAMGQMAGSAALAARSSLMAKANAGFNGRALLSAVAHVAVRASGAVSGIVPLVGIVSAKVKAFSAPVGSASLAARAAIEVMARGALSAAGALTSIIATGAIQFKAMGQIVGSTSLSARSGLKVMSRGALSAGGALTSVISTGAMQFKALGKLVGSSALAARSGLMTKANSGFSGLISLSSVARMATKAGGGMIGSAALSATALSITRASASFAGKLPLAARASAASWSVAAPRLVGALAALSATMALRVTLAGRLIARLFPNPRFGTVVPSRTFGRTVGLLMPQVADFSIMDVDEIANGWIDFNPWLAPGTSIASISSVTATNYLPSGGSPYVTLVGSAQIGTVPVSEGGSGVSGAAVLQQWSGASPGASRIDITIITSDGQELNAWGHQVVGQPN